MKGPYNHTYLFYLAKKKTLFPLMLRDRNLLKFLTQLYKPHITSIPDRTLASTLVSLFKKLLSLHNKGQKLECLTSTDSLLLGKEQYKKTNTHKSGRCCMLSCMHTVQKPYLLAQIFLLAWLLVRVFVNHPTSARNHKTVLSMKFRGQQPRQQKRHKYNHMALQHSWLTVS